MLIYIMINLCLFMIDFHIIFYLYVSRNHRFWQWLIE